MNDPTDRGSEHDRSSTTVDVDDILEELDSLEEEVSDADERASVRRVRDMLEHVPAPTQIHKYTSRDMGEAFIGGLVFSVPLLVEDGVFDIADWFASVTVGSVPILLAVNLLLIVGITAGLLYAVDVREVRIHRPVFGVLPRRLLGVLGISFICAGGMMLLWGRLHEGDPTSIETFARVTVVWASAALGAVLGDILPGESKGEDLSGLFDE